MQDGHHADSEGRGLRSAPIARRFRPGGFLLRRSGQNHSPGMYWSRINTERDRSRPAPLKSATVTNVSMLAIDVADARGRNLAIAAVISISNFLGRVTPNALSVVNDNSSPTKR